MDEALRELEVEEVIKKVATSEWAAPTISPVKKDGSVRVCGDFKVTTNPQLEETSTLFLTLIMTPAQVGVHCSVSLTSVTPAYIWWLRSTLGKYSP